MTEKTIIGILKSGVRGPQEEIFCSTYLAFIRCNVHPCVCCCFYKIILTIVYKMNVPGYDGIYFSWFAMTVVVVVGGGVGLDEYHHLDGHVYPLSSQRRLPSRER